MNDPITYSLPQRGGGGGPTATLTPPAQYTTHPTSHQASRGQTPKVSPLQHSLSDRPSRLTSNNSLFSSINEAPPPPTEQRPKSVLGGPSSSKWPTLNAERSERNHNMRAAVVQRKRQEERRLAQARATTKEVYDVETAMAKGSPTKPALRSFDTTLAQKLRSLEAIEAERRRIMSRAALSEMLSVGTTFTRWQSVQLEKLEHTRRVKHDLNKCQMAFYKAIVEKEHSAREIIVAKHRAWLLQHGSQDEAEAKKRQRAMTRATSHATPLVAGVPKTLAVRLKRAAQRESQEVYKKLTGKTARPRSLPDLIPPGTASHPFPTRATRSSRGARLTRGAPLVPQISPQRLITPKLLRTGTFVRPASKLTERPSTVTTSLYSGRDEEEDLLLVEDTHNWPYCSPRTAGSASPGGPGTPTHARDPVEFPLPYGSSSAGGGIPIHQWDSNVRGGVATPLPYGAEAEEEGEEWVLGAADLCEEGELLPEEEADAQQMSPYRPPNAAPPPIALEEFDDEGGPLDSIMYDTLSMSFGRSSVNALPPLPHHGPPSPPPTAAITQRM